MSTMKIFAGENAFASTIHNDGISPDFVFILSILLRKQCYYRRGVACTPSRVVLHRLIFSGAERSVLARCNTEDAY
jgi:hypothetical protein